MFVPPVRVAGEGAQPSDGDEELDDRRRFQYLAVLQYLQAKGLLETYVALEREAGVSYTEGSLPVAGVLEASLDMFSDYRLGQGQAGGSGQRAAEDDEAEEELQKLERGVCCTGRLEGACTGFDPMNFNVTAVRWVGRTEDEMLALVATAQKRLSLFDEGGCIRASFDGLSAPSLGLDVCDGADAEVDQEVLATAMGGEVSLLRLRHGGGDSPAFEFSLLQTFRDHTKHAAAGRFAPPVGGRARHFVTVSRDHSARLYARGVDAASPEAFALAGAVRLGGEVTCCCWATAETFVLAARDDHYLRYWDAKGSSNPEERLKANLNALGDSVVSFTVLALAVSPSGKLVAACTDKSRVIVLQAFTGRQLRNLYGAVVEEYDTPSVLFSLDGTFIYATSSLPLKGRLADEDVLDEASPGRCGQVAVFEVRTGELVLQLPCHRRAVRCMDRHAHKEALVTGSFDKTIGFWG